jgi:hypothetical protein
MAQLSPTHTKSLGAATPAGLAREVFGRLRRVAPVGAERSVGWLVLALAISGYVLMDLQRASLAVTVDYDPTLQYLFSSLAALKGSGYTYVDHPGTPLEVLGSLILVLMKMIDGSDTEEFIVRMIRQPERFLEVVDVLLWITNLAVVAAIMRWSISGKRFQEGAFAVACGACYFAVHPLAFSTLTLWSHNSFNLIAGSSLLLVLVLELRRGRRLRSWQVFALGFGAGALTSIQLYFAAWIVGITLTLVLYAVLLGETKALVLLVGLTALMGWVLGFLVCTFPIADEYLVFGRWVVTLIAHQGLYGGGPEGLPAPTTLVANATALIAQVPLLFVFLALILAVLSWRLWIEHERLGGAPGRWAASIGLTVQVLVLLLLIVKHPMPVFLLSVAATLPLLAACTLTCLQLRQQFRAWLPATTMSIVLLCVLWNGERSALRLLTIERYTMLAADSVATTLAQIAEDERRPRDSLQVVWTYGTNNDCFARWFGDRGPLRNEIADICPHDLSLDIFQRSIATGTGEKPIVAGDRWDALILAEEVSSQFPWLEELGDPVPLDAPSALRGRLLLVRNPRVPPAVHP